MRTVVLIVFCLLAVGFSSRAQELEITHQPYQGYSQNKDLLLYKNGVWYSDGDGASFWNGASATFFDATDGLVLDSVSAIGLDPFDSVLFMGGEGTVRKAGNTFQFTPSARPQYFPFLQRIGEDLWMSPDYPIYRVSIGENDQLDTTEYAINYEYLDDMVADSEGTLYVRPAFGGLLKKPAASDFEVISPNEFSWVESIHIDNSDNLWIGGYGELRVQLAGTDEFIEVENNLIVEGVAIRGMTSDSDGKMYLATSVGLIIIDDNTWIMLNLASGLPDENCHDVKVDDQGTIWLATWSGVTRIGNAAGIGPKVHGIVYQDLNLDGVKGGDEPGLKGHFIKLSPGNFFVITDSEGNFSFTPVDGSNTVTWREQSFWALNGATSESITFDYPENESPLLHFGLKWETVNDVAVSLSGTTTRPGFDVVYYINYSNEGSVPVSGTVAFKHDEQLTFLESSLDPDRISGNVYEWDFPNLEFNKSGFLALTFNVPATTALSTILRNVVSIDELEGELAILNNSDTLDQTVIGSFDPNDKLVKEGVLEDRYVLMDSRLTYTVRFQNTGTDKAFTVKVKDIIDPSFDIGSVKVVAASHPYEVSVNDRIFTFTFNNIELPDSTTNEPGSHGLIKYSIAPVAGLAENTVVKNKADIYFDFNSPVETNEVTNKYVTEIPDGKVTSIEGVFGKGVSLYPNPAKEKILLHGHERYRFDRMEMVSARGQRISQIPFSSVISTENLPNGIYLLRLYTGKKVASFRLVVDR